MEGTTVIVKKPWGYEEVWANNEKYIGKILHIENGKRLSHQYHNKKDETIRVLSGDLELILGDDTIVMKSGDVCRILPKTPHRMSAISECDILEVSTPEMLDVVRISDDYGR